jgi:hypothetical protein
VSPRHPSQRRAAAAFLAAAVPLAIAIATAGGIVALAPLALLVLPILALGRAPGVARLEELAARPRRRSRPTAMPAPAAPLRRRADGGLLLAARLTKRGPPLSC